MLKNNLFKKLIIFGFFISGCAHAQMIYEITDATHFTTSLKEGNKIGDQFKVFSSDDSKPMAIAQLMKCDENFCTYFVKKIRKGVVLQSGFRLEAAVPVKVVKKEKPEIKEIDVPSGRKWLGVGYGAPLPNVIRLEGGLQNIKGSDLDIGISIGQLPGSLGGIDLKGQTLGVSAQYRVIDYVLFWKVVPKFIGEIGIVKADLGLSPITKVVGDTNTITSPYGLLGVSLSQQFEKVYIDLGVAYSFNTIESPQVAPSKNEVSTPFAGSISLLSLSIGYMF